VHPYVGHHLHRLRGGHQLLLGGRHRPRGVLRLHLGLLHQRGVHGGEQHPVHPVPGWLVLPDAYYLDRDALHRGGQLLSGWRHRSGDVRGVRGRDLRLFGMCRFLKCGV